MLTRIFLCSAVGSGQRWTVGISPKHGGGEGISPPKGSDPTIEKFFTKAHLPEGGRKIWFTLDKIGFFRPNPPWPSDQLSLRSVSE